MANHTALVVGGTSGIGLATARRLHTLGATVHIVGRNKERLDHVAATDPALTGHRADGGNRDAVTAVIETISQIDWLADVIGSSSFDALVAISLHGLRRHRDDG